MKQIEIVLLQVFSEPLNQSPGNGTASTHLLEILIMLLGSAALGFLLHRAISNPIRKELIAAREKMHDLSAAESKNIQYKEAISSLEAQITQLEQKNFDLQNLIASSDTESKKVQSLASKNLDLETKVRSLENTLQKLSQHEEKAIQPDPNKPTPLPNHNSPKYSGIRLSTSKPAVEHDPYDLKQIEGISPGIHEILSKEGINTFDELAKKTPEVLSELLIKHGKTPEEHNIETWSAQATLARDGKWNVLKEIQAKLKGNQSESE